MLRLTWSREKTKDKNKFAFCTLSQKMQFSENKKKQFVFAFFSVVSDQKFFCWNSTNRTYVSAHVTQKNLKFQIQSRRVTLPEHRILADAGWGISCNFWR